MLQTAPKVLLVEDDEIQAAIIEDNLLGRDYQVQVAVDGEQAWDLLQTPGAQFDAILLDRGLPGMGGLELLRRIRADHRFDALPVILETASGDPASIREGLDAGAYYYLTKPFETSVLLAVVSAAIHQFAGQREYREDAESIKLALEHLDNGRFLIRTLDESQRLAVALARLCPEPKKVQLGLHELLVNAVEHGNLGISYEEKTNLILSDRLQQEWDRRLGLDENRDKTVEIVFRRQPGQLQFTIRDQGEGFDWDKYLEFDLERILDPNGKGIAMARKQSFESLEYQGNGNTVVATVRL